MCQGKPVLGQQCSPKATLSQLCKGATDTESAGSLPAHAGTLGQLPKEGSWCPEVVVGYTLRQAALTGADVMPTPAALLLFVPTDP